MPKLKEAIVKHQVEKQEAEDKRLQLAAAAAADENDPVFEADDALPPEAREIFNQIYASKKTGISEIDGEDGDGSSSNREAAKTVTSNVSGTDATGTKTFVADNGIAYFWDEEEQVRDRDKHIIDIFQTSQFNTLRHRIGLKTMAIPWRLVLPPPTKTRRRSQK